MVLGLFEISVITLPEKKSRDTGVSRVGEKDLYNQNE